MGGATLAHRNLIAGNLGAGIRITGPNATGNRIEGNVIGKSGIANQSHGIYITNGASGNVIGGKNEIRNIDVVRQLIATVHELAPESATKTADELITYVKDRPGHDQRYAIDPAKIDAPPRHLAFDHPKREYCVQYGETDHDFVFRLLAEEGITSFFDFMNESALRLYDDTTGKMPPGETVPFVAPGGVGMNPGPHVSSIEVSARVESSSVAVRDYDFENPGFVLRASAEDKPLFPNEHELELF